MSGERAVRNHIACELSASEAAVVFDLSDDEVKHLSQPVLCGLTSLAMGDSSACEFAQCSHLGVLVQGRAVFPGELLLQAAPPPRSLLSVGLVIDDLVVLERCLADQAPVYREHPGSSTSSRRLSSALAAYDSAQLRYSAKKTFSDATQASFWGIDCCGSSGLVRPNPARYWPLVLITSRVLQLGLATRALLESLLGSWVSVLMVRRRMLCLADLCFKAVRYGTPQTVLRLSPELASELAGFVLLGHFAVMDLRAPVLPKVIATDASSSWQAAVQADLHPQVAEEFQRHALQRGAWTRLLSPPAAWLREHALLDAEAELPGDFIFGTHPVAEAVSRVPAYRCLWRREYKARIHINVAELGAYLREEARLAGRVIAGRILCGLDSQVCLGALVKGRSASPVLNRMLASALGPLLASRIFPAYLFFPSALNPSDDPTRHQAVRPPSLQKPRWWQEIEEGRFDEFDAFLVVLKSHRERGLSSAAARARPGSRTLEVVRSPSASASDSAAAAFSAASVSSSPALLAALRSVPLAAFLTRNGAPVDLCCPGALLLSRPGTNAAKHLLRHGAPWVLLLDPAADFSMDWVANGPLRRSIAELCRLQFFGAVAAFPYAASFSRAVRPPVRSSASPSGLPHLSPGSLCKVRAENALFSWLASLASSSADAGVAFAVEGPDTSLVWQSPGWERAKGPDSGCTFRVDLCQFGCHWKRRTRVFTNTLLAGARLLCSNRASHLRLSGRSRAHRLPWTSVAANLPASFVEAVAIALCYRALWTSARPLDPAACAKLGDCCRIGEASNPGPRRPSVRARTLRRSGDLESRPLQSETSLQLGNWAWISFVRWVSAFLSVDPLSLFASCPVLAAIALRAYGNHLFAAGGSKHSFRYTLVGAQRALSTLKGAMGPAWELLTRWEAAEPTQHRIPIPEPLLRAMVVIAWLKGLRRWAACALLAFYGMARIGEVLSCQRKHLLLEDDLFHSANAIFLRLDTSKTSTRGSMTLPPRSSSQSPGTLTRLTSSSR